MRAPRGSVLDDAIKTAGYEQVAGLRRLYDSVQQTEPSWTRDQIWISIEQAIWRGFVMRDAESLHFLQMRLTPKEEATVKQCRKRLYEHYSEAASLAQLVLDISAPWMESNSISTVEPDPFVAQAMEALLWRARDGLESAVVLSARGLGIDSDLCLRACQEALICFEYFLSRPDRVKDFTIRSEVIAAELGMDFRDWPALKGHHIPKIETQLQAHLERLQKLGIENNTEPPSKKAWLNKKGKVKLPVIGWKEMADSRTFENDDHKENTIRSYHTTFFCGDCAAHSRPSIWPVWAQIEKDRVRTVGRVEGRPMALGIQGSYVPVEFLAALERCRHGFPDGYRRFAISLLPSQFGRDRHDEMFKCRA